MHGRKKILFAVGGTGGHIYPAQALARDLQKTDGDVEILFGGGRLASNPYFHHEQFPYHEVESCSPFREGALKTAITLSRGVKESLSLIREFSPQLVVGFGSFHSFPLLVAARLKKIPYFLVESNAFPGKVNRLFSGGALLSALQFGEAGEWLKGKSVCVNIPFWSDGENLPPSKEVARDAYGLESHLTTLLVFGGSQGASAINRGMEGLMLEIPYQVIHICGKGEDLAQIEKSYQKRGIRAYVSPFEHQMERAWAAADFVICRSGAGTLNEMVAHGVPGLLIPWPGAADGHQKKNAQVLAKSGGALLMEEGEMSKLSERVAEGIERMEKMQEALHLLRGKEKKELSELVLHHLLEGRQ